jgi:hypothetical protein
LRISVLLQRTEEVRNKIEETLNKLGLEYPNYGLYMYPRANTSRNMERK